MALRTLLRPLRRLARLRVSIRPANPVYTTDSSDTNAPGADSEYPNIEHADTPPRSQPDPDPIPELQHTTEEILQAILASLQTPFIGFVIAWF